MDFVICSSCEEPNPANAGKCQKCGAEIVEVPDVPCALEQTEPREVLFGRETYDSTHRAAFLGGTELDGSDEVVIDGTTFEVLGDPSRGHFPSSGEVVVEAILREVR